MNKYKVGEEFIYNGDVYMIISIENNLYKLLNSRRGHNTATVDWLNSTKEVRKLTKLERALK